MEAPEASVGVAPWFLSCQACKWDSKRAFRGGGGYVFEKSAGINGESERERKGIAAEAARSLMLTLSPITVLVYDLQRR
jgi:hypothetical protein